jgi:hypothetical protein
MTITIFTGKVKNINEDLKMVVDLILGKKKRTIKNKTMPYNNSPVKNEMTKTVKVFDKKTGKTTTLTQKDGKYYKAGQLVQLTPNQSPINYGSPLNAHCGSPAKAKSSYMMYGKEAAPMMSESPLAYSGCSGKFKKSK